MANKEQTWHVDEGGNVQGKRPPAHEVRRLTEVAKETAQKVGADVLNSLKRGKR
jgi:hypothetical protein